MQDDRSAAPIPFMPPQDARAPEASSMNPPKSAVSPISPERPSAEASSQLSAAPLASPMPEWIPLGPLADSASRSELADAVAHGLPLAAAIRKRAGLANPALRELVRLGGRARLASTHQALWRAGPASARAADFFLNDIYPAKAPAWRDGQALAAMGSMARLLPMPALMALARAVRLDLATEAIDERIGMALRQAGWPRSTPAIDAASPDFSAAFAAAQESSGFRPRAEQLFELMAVAQALVGCARLPFAAQALGAMSLPARLAGLSDLQGFLERGLAAFKGLPDPEGFCRQLGEAERSAMGK